LPWNDTFAAILEDGAKQGFLVKKCRLVFLRRAREGYEVDLSDTVAVSRTEIGPGSTKKG